MSGHHPKGGPPESVPPATACGCPQRDGITYHQKGTCADPVVAALSWYGTPPATATPGKAAYEAHAAMVVPRPWRWDQLDGKLRAAWEAAVQAGIDCYNDSRADWPNEADLAQIAARGDGLPAPELAAAMAETRAVRDGYQELCGEFGQSMQSGMSARISLTMLNRHHVRAGLPELRRARRDDAEDAYLRLRRERDEARELVAEILGELDQWELLVEDDKRAGWRQRAGLEAGGA